MPDSPENEHYEAEHLLAYLHDRLNDDDMARVERHLATCDECAERSSAVFRTSEALRNWDALEEEVEAYDEVEPVESRLGAAGLVHRLRRLVEVVITPGEWSVFPLQPQFGAVQVSGGPVLTRGSGQEEGAGKFTVEASGAEGLVRVRLEDPGDPSRLPTVVLMAAGDAPAGL